MTGVLVVLVLLLIAALWVVASKLAGANERTAQALAQSMARGIKDAAEKKAQGIADAAVKEVQNASDEDLERRVRDLARRDRLP